MFVAMFHLLFRFLSFFLYRFFVKTVQQWPQFAVTAVARALRFEISKAVKSNQMTVSNLSNLRHAVSRHFREKKRNIWTVNLMYPNIKNNNIKCLYTASINLRNLFYRKHLVVFFELKEIQTVSGCSSWRKSGNSFPFRI